MGKVPMFLKNAQVSGLQVVVHPGEYGVSGGRVEHPRWSCLLTVVPASKFHAGITMVACIVLAQYYELSI
jgi:hypothetical protein